MGNLHKCTKGAWGGWPKLINMRRMDVVLLQFFVQGNELGNWFYVYSGVSERNIRISFNLKYT
jgi:hypothetical protein